MLNKCILHQKYYKYSFSFKHTLYLFYLHIWHKVPVQPGRHEQVKLVPRSEHVPQFKHRFNWQMLGVGVERTYKGGIPDVDVDWVSFLFVLTSVVDETDWLWRIPYWYANSMPVELNFLCFTVVHIFYNHNSKYYKTMF